MGRARATSIRRIPMMSSARPCAAPAPRPMPPLPPPRRHSRHGRARRRRPASTWALVDILHRAGLPKGVLNLVIGRGSEVGAALLEHPDVAAISFTGSVVTGHKVAAACVASRPMKKFQLEMGGKNPLVILDDADLKVAVECAVNSA